MSLKNQLKLCFPNLGRFKIEAMMKHTSSPSFMTTVPALLTTANTMTAHSALLTDMVMLAKAGRWRMKSSSSSVKKNNE